MKKKLTAIDLFAGAGGLSLAAYNSGINVIAAIELDRLATESYRKNLVIRMGATTQVLNEDINKVEISNLIINCGIKVGELDILLGGPPCQGFSSHRINNAGLNDPRNILLIKYFDFVEKLKPKSFLVENVSGLLWPRHSEYLEKFIDLANKNGYKIYSDNGYIVNAKDYGVPQNRKRAFIFALREDIVRKGFFWPPRPTHTKNGDLQWITASTVFEKPEESIIKEFTIRLSNKIKIDETSSVQIFNNLQWGKKLDENDPCNIYMKHTNIIKELFENTPLLGGRSESGRELDCHKNYEGHKDVYGRMYPHLPANTITTGCNNPSKGRFVHPWKSHGISLRHAARLQTFPDEFIFFGDTTSIAKQIGNAVPVNLGQALLNHIKNYLIDI